MSRGSAPRGGSPLWEGGGFVAAGLQGPAGRGAGIAPQRSGFPRGAAAAASAGSSSGLVCPAAGAGAGAGAVADRRAKETLLGYALFGAAR